MELLRYASESQKNDRGIVEVVVVDVVLVVVALVNRCSSFVLVVSSG